MKNTVGVGLAAIAHEEGQVPVSGTKATEDGSEGVAATFQEELFGLKLSESGSVVGNEVDAGDHDGAIRRVVLGRR